MKHSKFIELQPWGSVKFTNDLNTKQGDYMDIFNQLSQMGLRDEHFNIQSEFLIEGLLPKNLITFYWAEGGNGKSFLSQAIAKHVIHHNKVKRVTYLDLDNPVGVLKDRGINETLVEQYPNLDYIQRSRVEMTGFELLLLIEEGATGGAYKDCLFIFDSLRNFVDVMNEGRVMRAMDAFMNIREAGATILILGHANKDGKNYQGSNNIKNSIDCMYALKKTFSDERNIEFLLTVQKERAGIENCAWHVDTTVGSFTLSKKEYKRAAMSEYDKEFTTKVIEALTKHPDGLNKTELLEYVGHKKDDRTARDALDRYDDDLWNGTKVSNVITYTLKSKQP